MSSKSFKTKSKHPKKQHKAQALKQMHTKSAELASHLSKELRKETGHRSARARTGDEVIIMSGQFKKIKGAVERVDVKRGKIYVTGATQTKKQGGKSPYPLNPSNLLIIKLNREDKRRFKTKTQEIKNTENKQINTETKIKIQQNTQNKPTDTLTNQKNKITENR